MTQIDSTVDRKYADSRLGEVIGYDEALAAFDPVLGLEVHVELNTATKMFCGCATGFGEEPNTQVCPVCLGLPGALPVLNAAALESAIRIGLALHCSIADWCRFARKNYFYPDMPKNFQTSQYDEPIAFNGYLDVELEDGEIFRVEIERAHMEEDTGKSLHVGGSTGRIQGAEYSLVDYNRAGIPLIEIVTKTIEGAGERAPEVAKAYVAALRELLRALGVSDVKMEQGSLRCDANASLRPKAKPGEDQSKVKFGTRTETKNVNSLRSIERAVRYEITRQASVLSNGGTILQETRHWHEDTGVTTSGREKSDADDYRYFPEPDLVPIAPDSGNPGYVARLKATLPEPPPERRRRLQAEWSFADKEMRDLYNAGAVELVEATVAAGASPASARKWWTGELARRANLLDDVALADLPVTPAQVAQLQSLVDAGTLNDTLARQALDGVLAGEGDPAQVVAARGLAVVSDDGALGAAIDRAIEANPGVADKIRAGKVAAAGALIGSVMKEMRGQADAARVRELILERLPVADGTGADDAGR
jgi:aspartyl-tRNA(Asn)/glutamyl-tRNA(Gln) amidotransferase subunit B